MMTWCDLHVFLPFSNLEKDKRYYYYFLDIKITEDKDNLQQKQKV